MTDPSSNVCSTDNDESKRIIGHETLSNNCSVNKDEIKKGLSTKLYRRTIPRTWTNYVILSKTNQNALLRNKKMQGMRLHIMCLILTSLTYLNAEETILACHMKEHTWKIQAMNTLRRCLTI